MELKTLPKPWPIWLQFTALFLWVSLLALFFAQVEIQIEGEHGWATSLPTWRIEKHWALDLFWGGRPMTGYHLWVFSFMALFFHIPIFLNSKWTFKIEARILACIMWFWICEDFLWFVFNPAYGISGFHPANVAWHKHWFLFMPVDYWVFILVSAALFYSSYKGLPNFLSKQHQRIFKKSEKQ